MKNIHNQNVSAEEIINKIKLKQSDLNSDDTSIVEMLQQAIKIASLKQSPIENISSRTLNANIDEFTEIFRLK